MSQHVRLACPSCGTGIVLSAEELQFEEAEGNCPNCEAALVFSRSGAAVSVALDAKERRNCHPEFVGGDEIKRKQLWQLKQFEEWSRRRAWMEFRNHHYDWWMFPIDGPSMYGYAWTVYEAEVKELKTDPVYIQNYLRGVELLALSWGWDFPNAKHVEDPDPEQGWHDWAIRLYKVVSSLELFGLRDQHKSMHTFARDLIKRGADMSYGQQDLSDCF